MAGEKGASALYLPDGWDAGWRAAKAASGAVPAQIAAFGGSIVMGSVGPTDLFRDSWLSLVRARLVERWGLAGDFFTPAHSQDFFTLNAVGTLPGVPPFVVSSAGRSNPYSVRGYASAPVHSTTGTPDQVVFTTPYECADLDIVHLDNGAGTWTYSVDGGADVTVTNSGAGGVQKRIGLSGLGWGTHTLRFGNQSAGNVMCVMGVATWASRARGIALARMAFHGASAQAFAHAQNAPADRPLLWQGKTATDAVGFGFPTQPHLAILGFGINDCSSGVGVQQLAGTLRRFVRAFRRGRDGASVLLVAHNLPDGVSSDVTTTFGSPTQYERYVEAMYGVAAALRCGLLNVHAKWGGRGYASGFLPSNDAHPTVAGYADIAADVAALLV